MYFFLSRDIGKNVFRLDIGQHDNNSDNGWQWPFWPCSIFLNFRQGSFTKEEVDQIFGVINFWKTMNKYRKIQLLRISKFISPIFSDFLLPHLFDFLELSQAEVFEPSLEILKPEHFFILETARQKSTRNKNMQFSKQRQEKSHKTQKIKQKVGENCFQR